MKSVAEHLKDILNLKALDTGIYSRRRMWRIPDSIHSKTGLYCVELDVNELKNKTIDEIKELAQRSRGSLYDIEEIEENPDAVEWFNEFVKEYENKPKAGLLPVPIEKIASLKDDATCIKDLLEHGLKKPFTRLYAVMSLIAYFRDKGFTEDRVRDMVLNFVRKIPENLTGAKMSEREAHVIWTTRNFFRTGQKYVFGCGFIKALGDRNNRIACDGNSCPLNKQKVKARIV